MKLNLKQQISTSANGKEFVPLGELLERSVFDSVPGVIKNPKGLYDKIKGQKEVDLTVEELSALKQACNALFISGVAWTIEDILEGRNNGG